MHCPVVCRVNIVYFYFRFGLLYVEKYIDLCLYCALTLRTWCTFLQLKNLAAVLLQGADKDCKGPDGISALEAAESEAIKAMLKWDAAVWEEAGQADGRTDGCSGPLTEDRLTSLP